MAIQLVRFVLNGWQLWLIQTKVSFPENQLQSSFQSATIVNEAVGNDDSFRWKLESFALFLSTESVLVVKGGSEY